MNRLFQKTIIALLVIVWSATSIQAQNVNTDRYIKLTVEQGQKIKLSLWADAAGTPIKIVSGVQEQTVTVGSTWSSYQDYTAGDGTMTIYGNVQRLKCEKNGKNLTDIDLSHNPQMTMLYCEENALSTLDISKNAKLTRLSCQKNALTALDVSHNKQLENLNCFSNKLKALDVSSNEKLVWLNCYDNDFTTASLDNFFCSLPDRENKSVGKIGLVFNAASPEKDKVLATNGRNAIAKNWTVQYYEDKSGIKGFTGNHRCTTSGLDDIKNTQDISVYPNPVEDVLNITSDKPVHSIRIYNVYGTEVLRATDTNSIDVSNLPAGVYMVRADGKVVRVIKK